MTPTDPTPIRGPKGPAGDQPAKDEIPPSTVGKALLWTLILLATLPPISVLLWRMALTWEP